MPNMPSAPLALLSAAAGGLYLYRRPSACGQVVVDDSILAVSATARHEPLCGTGGSSPWWGRVRDRPDV